MALLIIVLAILATAVALASWLTIFFTHKPLDLGFLGALIGAAGTIFAATIAYVAVQKQIDYSEVSAKEGAKRSAEFAAKQAAIDLSGLKMLQTWFHDLLKQFEGLNDTSDVDYLNALEKLFASGKLTSFMGQAPMEFYPKGQEAYQRIIGVHNAISQWMATTPTEAQRDRRSEFNENVHQAVKRARELSDSVDAEIVRRTRP